MPQFSATDDRLLFLNPKDNVCTAIAPIETGATIKIGGHFVVTRQTVPLGFKLAACNIAAQHKIVKYGVPIGSATRDIVIGEVVHLHNMKSDYLPTSMIEHEDSHDQRA